MIRQRIFNHARHIRRVLLYAADQLLKIDGPVPQAVMQIPHAIVVMQMKTADLPPQIVNQREQVPSVGVGMPHINEHPEAPFAAQTGKLRLVQQLRALRPDARIFHAKTVEFW